jgi:hypothetical protein
MFGVPFLPNDWSTPARAAYVMEYTHSSNNDDKDNSINVTVKCMTMADNLMIYAQAKV